MKNFIAKFSTAVIILLFVATTAPVGAAEVVITDKTFGCVHTGTKIRKTYIRNDDPAKLKEAVRIFENNIEGVGYPEGTILQLVPNEAMVKHAKSAFPNTNGWEFFSFQVSAEGTKILERGEKASNRLGTCLSCHQAGAKFDYVCEKGHGCGPIPVTDERLLAMQAADPRCPAR